MADNAPFRWAKMHSVDQSGNWLVESCDSGTAITVKEADLNLLKKMLWINVFRMQCLFAFRWGDMGAKKHDTKIRKFLSRSLTYQQVPWPTMLSTSARFSIEAIMFTSRSTNVEGKSDLVVPAIAPYLGTVMATVHPTHPTKPSCFPCWMNLFSGTLSWARNLTFEATPTFEYATRMRMSCHQIY